MENRIIITVEGGLIQDIQDIPLGTVIEVRDYDTDGVEEIYTCVEWVGEDFDMSKCEMCGQPVKDKEFYACTGWTAEDIMMQAEEEEDMTITKEQAVGFLEAYSDKIVEEMVREGWSVIQYFLAENRREAKNA